MNEKEPRRKPRFFVFVGMLCEEIVSVLFGTAGAKRTKNAELFRACGRDLGRCPKTLQAFEKA